MVGAVIVIDNGSFECRAGFCTKNEPILKFKNVVLKSRSRNRETYVGSIDELDMSQVNTKSAFEQNVVTQLDVQEIVFDHIFESLEITSDRVNFPVVISEPLCCPQQARSQITELLFETYSVDRLTYFVDGLSSFYSNFGADASAFNADTMVLSFGHNTTHIIPFSGGAFIPPACRRMSVGGAHISYYLRHLLSLKYPRHSDKFTISVAEKLVHTFGSVCENYREEMQRWKDEAYRHENSHTWCIPYSNETQRKAEELIERKQFQADRLRELHRIRALDKLRGEWDGNDEAASQSSSEEAKRARRIEEMGIEAASALTSANDGAGDTTVLQKLINLREKRATELLGSLIFPSAVQTQMTTSLPNSNNQELTEQKIRRRALAAIDFEARRGDDFCLWLSRMNNKRQRIAKQRTQRQSKVDLATELGLHSGQDAILEERLAGSSVSERKQRKIEKIRAMTNELRGPDRAGKRAGGGRGGASAASTCRKSTVRKDAGRSATAEVGVVEVWMEGDEQELDLDSNTAATLLSVDDSPDGSVDTLSNGMGAKPEGETDGCGAGPTSPTLIYVGTARPRDAFDRLEEDADDVSEGERDQLAVLDSLRAAYDPEFLKETGTVGLKVDISEYYKAHLTTEPIRATEILFERSLMGDSQAGVGECMSWVLRDSSQYLFSGNGTAPSAAWAPRLLFLTGGSALLPGMPHRLYLELQQLLPWREGGNPLDVVVAADPSLDAWKGARKWCQLAAADGFRHIPTRKEYDECGFDYLVENVISNRFYAKLKDLEVNPKYNPGRGRQPL